MEGLRSRDSLKGNKGIWRRLDESRGCGLYNGGMNKDKVIVCQDCGQEFAFTADEQEFYVAKKLAEPKYCMVCRGKYAARERDLGQYKKR